ncbi:MAG: hypothetical protein AAF658_20910, partial [Myxococcota bacterium]
MNARRCERVLVLFDVLARGLCANFRPIRVREIESQARIAAISFGSLTPGEGDISSIISLVALLGSNLAVGTPIEEALARVQTHPPSEKFPERVAEHEAYVAAMRAFEQDPSQWRVFVEAP